MLLVFLAGVDSSSVYTSFIGFYLWRGRSICFSDILALYVLVGMHGERRCGAALGTSSAAIWAIGKFGEGVGRDRSIGVATLGGGLKATLGGGAVSRGGSGMMGDVTHNFYGAVLSVGAVRKVIFLLRVCCAGSSAAFLFAAAWTNIFCRFRRAVRDL